MVIAPVFYLWDNGLRLLKEYFPKVSILRASSEKMFFVFNHTAKMTKAVIFESITGTIVLDMSTKIAFYVITFWERHMTTFLDGKVMGADSKFSKYKEIAMVNNFYGVFLVQECLFMSSQPYFMSGSRL